MTDQDERITKTMILRILASCLSLSIIAAAEFETWTNKEGRSAELDLILVVKSEKGIAGDFFLKNGKVLTINESDLSSESAGKLRSQKVSQVDFVSCSSSGNLASFSFVARGSNLLCLKAPDLQVKSFETLGEKKWSGQRIRNNEYSLSHSKVVEGEVDEDFKVLPFTLALEGKYTEEELDQSTVTGNMTLVFGFRAATTTGTLRYKSRKTETQRSVTGKVGPFVVTMAEGGDPFEGETISLIEITDTQMKLMAQDVTLSKTGLSDGIILPSSIRFIEVDVFADGKKIKEADNTRVKVKDEVTFTIRYWSDLHEKSFPFEKKPDTSKPVIDGDSSAEGSNPEIELPIEESP